jgi:hypothetical protein
VTRTRVDTGGWLWKSRLVACCAASGSPGERGQGASGSSRKAGRQDGELVLFAAGKRPFVERVPFAQLGESFYNHVTGEVALAPAEGARVRKLRMSPVDGRALLKELGIGNRR